MRALVLQHIAIEGPGVLAPLLQQRGWEVESVALYAGAHLPQPQVYQAIIVMGGPMGVHDEADYPFLRAEHDFLRQAMAHDVPILGICLGSQLLAKALGAHVYRNPVKEIGWDTVALTPDGLADPLFAGVSSPVRVFQWHGDAFDLPVGATWLASSARCRYQAFRYRDRVYGLLFHLELTPEIVQSWLDAFQEDLASVAAQTSAAQIMADIPRYLDGYRQTRTQVFANLFETVWEPLAMSGNSRRAVGG
jgi:GMP synthase-like glutamine amidotransferase